MIDTASAVDPTNVHHGRGCRLWRSSSRTTNHPASAPTSAAANTSAGPTVPSPAETTRSIPMSRMNAQVASAAAGARTTVPIRRRVR